MSDDIIDMHEWYTAPQALERLEANSGKKLDPGYPRLLGRIGKVEVKIISERIRLYRKRDIDAYIVEDRGVKAGRAQRQRAVETRRKTKSQGITKRPKKGQAGNASTMIHFLARPFSQPGDGVPALAF